MMPDTPNPSMGMEAFMDTAMVNGTAYPYLEVDPTLVRFRILNAADDRFFNLQMYVADPNVVTADGRRNTEVTMVPALATPGFPPTWPTDGRDGGAPDPGTAGPAWIQLGTEGGFLPNPVEIPAQPINWNRFAPAFNFGNVTDHSLLLGCAERADVLVDFSQYAGKTLILYNDAPAAFPALDPRYDYYTGNLNQMDTGGTPTTQAGYGPNTRTIMQIRVKASSQAGGAITGVHVTQGGTGYMFTPDVEITGGGGAGATATATAGIEKITVVSPGSLYTTPPRVEITGGGGAGATAVAKIAGGRVTGIQVTYPGSGYTSAPSVTILPPGPYHFWFPVMNAGVQPAGGGSGVVNNTAARAVATLTVNAVTVTSGGSGYTSAPDVSFISGGGQGAVAFANLNSGPSYDPAPLNAAFVKTATNRGIFEVSQDPMIIPQAEYNSAFEAAYPSDMRAYVAQHDFDKSFFNGPLAGLTVTNPGSGYAGPTITFAGGGGAGAAAAATVDPVSGAITRLVLTNPGSGYTSAPTVSITGVSGSGAVATAVVPGGSIAGLTLAGGGNGYPGPVVTITDGPGGAGTGAAAEAAVDSTGAITRLILVNPGRGYTNPTIEIGRAHV